MRTCWARRPIAAGYRATSADTELQEDCAMAWDINGPWAARDVQVQLHDKSLRLSGL